MCPAELSNAIPENIFLPIMGMPKGIGQNFRKFADNLTILNQIDLGEGRFGRAGILFPVFFLTGKYRSEYDLAGSARGEMVMP